MKLTKLNKTIVIELTVALIFAGGITTGLLMLGPGDQSRDGIKPAAPITEPAVATGENPSHELQALQVELKKNPKHTPILFRMAQISREIGKPAEAVVQFRQVIDVEPKNADAHLELGRALYETNDLAGAIDQTNQVLMLDPNHADALYNMGAIYANLNRTDDARRYWERAVKAGPQTDSGARAREALLKLDSPR